MKNIRQSLFFLLPVLILSGCVIQPPAPVEQIPPAKPPELTKPLPQFPTPESLKEPDAMLTVPKIYDYRWNETIQPLAESMIQAASTTQGGVLMISKINNLTNGLLPTDAATTILMNALTGNHQFSLIPSQQLTAAREKLGLSADDSLLTKGKALSIGRIAGAQYVLYTSASGRVDAPVLQMQLLQVQTGEIIWSGSKNVSLH